MATKNGLRVYPEKASGNSKYRVVMDYYHPYEGKWKQVTCKTDSTTKTALDLAKNKLTLKVNQLLGDNKKKVNLTVSEALDSWHSFRKGSVAEGTYDDDRDYTRLFREKFGKWLLSKVEKDKIKDFLTALEVAHSSRKIFKSKLNLFFEFCEDEGYIKESPMYRIRLPKHKETLEEKEKREDKYFTVGEMAKLLEAMERKAVQSNLARVTESYRRMRLLIEFQFSLGDRISESLGLRYQDIDFERGILHLRTQFDGAHSSVSAPKLAALKTKHSERDIRLKVRELEIIHWFQERNEDNSDFIFIKANGSLYSSSDINYFLKKFCEVLPYKLKSSFTTHAMRHGNVMLQKERGVDEQVIVQRGGWSDTQMISRVYGRHVTPLLQAQADLALKDFSVKNSQNIHKRTEQIGDEWRVQNSDDLLEA